MLTGDSQEGYRSMASYVLDHYESKVDECRMRNIQAECERLEKENARLKVNNEVGSVGYKALCEKAEELDAENTRLKEVCVTWEEENTKLKQAKPAESMPHLASCDHEWERPGWHLRHKYLAEEKAAEVEHCTRCGLLRVKVEEKGGER